jgi:release factor glutamine methyltransferase
MTIREALARARARLAGSDLATSPREASLLLGHLLGRGEAQLLARDDEPLPAPIAVRFASLLDRRLRGEPVAYLLGRREFWGREFAVDARVLVPRPETEHLIEAALALAPRLPPAPRLLDLGTGSGCIAITLALELPGSRVAACDRSTAALALARRNARQLGGRVAFVAADWARPLDVARFDLLVSNPPYLDPGAPVPRDVADWEPPGALWGGEAGLAEYRALLAGLARARPGTPLLVEIGAGQGAAFAALARELGWRAVETRRDLAAIERVVTLVRAAHDDAPEAAPHATAR